MLCESRIGGIPGSGSVSTAGTGDELPTGLAGNVDADAEGGGESDVGAAPDEMTSGELIGRCWDGECCPPGDAPALLRLEVHPAAPNAASATIATVRPVADRHRLIRRSPRSLMPVLVAGSSAVAPSRRENGTVGEGRAPLPDAEPVLPTADVSADTRADSCHPSPASNAGVSAPSGGLCWTSARLSAR